MTSKTPTRLLGIGGSEMAGVLGLSRWKTPLSIWAEKTGLVEHEDMDDNERVQWGKLLEPVVADEYARRTVRTIRPSGATLEAPRFSVSHPFLFGTPDRMVSAFDSRGEAILEIKTTGAHLAKDWTEEPPLEAQIQAQLYAFIFEVQWVSIAVLIGGQKLVYQDIPRSDPFIKVMLDRAADFWECVQTRKAPKVSSSLDLDLMRRLYPAETRGQVVTLPEEAIDMDQQRSLLKAEIKQREESVAVLDAHLQQLIGTAEEAILPDLSGKYTWKTSHRKEYTVAAQDVRQMRRCKV